MKIVIFRRRDNKPIWFILLLLFFIQPSHSQRLSQSLRVSHGAVNGVFIEKDGASLVVYGDPDSELKKAEMVLFTHFRRDITWAGRKLAQSGSRVVAPYLERPYFTSGDSIWTYYNKARFHDYYNQTTKIGIYPFKTVNFVKGGEILKWHNLEIKVINTPGYTRGAVSYIADIDNKRFAFVGDLIYGDGKIIDLYSFQDSLSDIRGYHGYATRFGQLISSLQTIASQKPDFIIPARGPVIKDPASSIQTLIKRLQEAYSNYLTISAFRWYSPERVNLMSDHVLGLSSRPGWRPYSEVIVNNPPSWYNHFGNTNLVFADDGSAFLIDCGTKSAFDKIMKMKQSGQLKSLDGIFITHYHDDHTDLINDVVKEFKCPVYITVELKDILENPSAYHMPCLTTSPITGLKIVQNGQKMVWKDFTLTFFYFPGQTIYHDAVLFEKSSGESVFFIGDSFTPSGIDDYCLLNRNLIYPGKGYLHCLDIIKDLPGKVLLANQHVAPLFAFSREQLDYMTIQLNERMSILRDLLPWDNINYGLDEQWVKIYPYGLKAMPGQVLEFSVNIVNHSEASKTYIIEPNAPDGFVVEPGKASIIIGPQNEGAAAFKLKVSKRVAPGISLLTAGVSFDNWDLREWTEALIEIPGLKQDSSSDNY